MSRHESNVSEPFDVETIHVHRSAVRIVADVAGEGDAVLLLHGFPHTRAVWTEVTSLLLGEGLCVIAPDLRGTGESDRADDGYDAVTLAQDQLDVLDQLGVARAHVVGFDIGAAPAFVLAAAHPDRVASLTLLEAIVGGLPGAESASPTGAPWWFSFHQVPGGFAESVVHAASDRYIRYFLDTGSVRGVPNELADAFVRSYSGRAGLRGGFEHYRAMPANAEWAANWAETGRLAMPVTAIGAATVGGALAQQLEPIAHDLRPELFPESGHIVPVDTPDSLATAILDTVTRSRDRPSGSRRITTRSPRVRTRQANE